MVVQHLIEQQIIASGCVNTLPDMVSVQHDCIKARNNEESSGHLLQSPKRYFDAPLRQMLLLQCVQTNQKLSKVICLLTWFEREWSFELRVRLLIYRC
jgi:hypothetical protein